ncbi:MAG: UpxY family transcription antiterminator [Deltaproteobacteria bacterium]|nr:UpxY family transcription antiterminator [Deltaproteobacteria bacterium]MBW2310549.1 UpxY family transcription antiterminator [Deltaproteobacteria bacterium]
MSSTNHDTGGNHRQWYAVHARSRHEDVVFHGLTKKMIETFLPRMQVMSRRKDRRKRILVPLLPGYLFVHTDMNPYQYWDIIKTYGVVRVIGIKGKPVPVKDEEIESLRILDGTDRTVSNQAYIKQGDKIMIMEGALKGLTGYYMKHKGKSDKVVVSIELLQRSLAVEIENWRVEKVV